MQELRGQGKTYYFHDYETFGINPQLSQASQFAGVRTDENLNIIEGSELNIYCSDRDDQLPSPMACLVTRITPQHIQRQNPSVVFNEYDFAKIIQKEMAKPNTCNIGYNSMNFDDEWSRNLFYRNYLDPYEREWKNGCSRADGLNIVMMTYLYNSSILNFPQSKDENGDLLFDVNGNPLPSFKLEELSSANGIVHENAHDALSDVIALIGLLKIIKQKDPKLFEYAMSLNDKTTVSNYMTKFRTEQKPFLHVSSFYGKKNNSCSVVMHIANDFKNKNNVYVFDLSKDPSVLLNMTPEQVKENLFAKNTELEERGVERIGIKSIAINKLPMFFELDEIKHRAKEIGLADNANLYRENIAKLKDVMVKMDLAKFVNDVFNNDYDNTDDPDRAIYCGFASNDDKRDMDFLHSYIENGRLIDFRPQFKVKKFNDLFLRFLGRNFKNIMTKDQLTEWYDFCRSKLNSSADAEYSFDMYFDEINSLLDIHKDNDVYTEILKELIEYGEQKKKLLK